MRAIRERGGGKGVGGEREGGEWEREKVCVGDTSIVF